uniref:Uncharacterized protein n=1 Tax=Sphaeramia orbicularis TaxID=375764 RepID=A0A673C9N5_9TELE
MDMLFLWQLQAFVDGLGIVAGCIIIGVSRECDADAVGGIFLGAGGLGESEFTKSKVCTAVGEDVHSGLSTDKRHLIICFGAYVP